VTVQVREKAPACRVGLATGTGWQSPCHLARWDIARQTWQDRHPVFEGQEVSMPAAGDANPKVGLPGHPVAVYAAASLSPAVVLVLGGALGGVWALFGLLWMTLFLFLADRLARRKNKVIAQNADDIWFRRLSVLLGVLHFPLLSYAVFVLSGGTGLGFWSWIGCFLGFGLWFGQVSNAVAHELIHRPQRGVFRLGMWIYISLLIGHHTSAHRLIHHRFVATPDDPNTAQAGETFYDFALRAWPGSYLAGHEMETARRADGKGGLLHPYTVYLAGAALCILMVAAAFGFLGVCSYVLLAAHAQAQLFLSDYVQHYGLERRKTGLDSYEPFGPAHSWDAPDVVSGLMMLNAPRHADHHLNPNRAYPQLELCPQGQAPLLPFSLPVMASIALVPRLWRHVMDPRLAQQPGGGN
jgi:alkane 1-monooxygenase